MSEALEKLPLSEAEKHPDLGVRRIAGFVECVVK
jgi:hypothetical protein